MVVGNGRLSVAVSDGGPWSAGSDAVGHAGREMNSRQIDERDVSSIESGRFASNVGGGRCCLEAKIRDRLQERPREVWTCRPFRPSVVEDAPALPLQRTRAEQANGQGSRLAA